MATSSSIAASTSISTPALGDDPPLAKPPQQVILRAPRLSDVPILGEICTDAYSKNPAVRLICPRGDEYREDVVRGHRQSIRQRLFNPRVFSVVACFESDPSTPLGYGQFNRLGDDSGAQEYIKQHGLLIRIRMFLLGWFFWLLNKVENYFWPDRATDFGLRGQLIGWGADDNKLYWEPFPERKNRWQAVSVIVDPKWQGRGIGRKIMLEAMAIAQRERVPMGLAASPEGERLYVKLGFEKLGDFTHRIEYIGAIGDQEELDGGIMIWYPEGMDRK